MEGSATLTIDASKTTTNCAAASRASASHLALGRSEAVMRTCLQAEGELRFRLSPYDTESRFRLSSTTSTPPPPERSLRADARRNREAIVDAARAIVAEQGVEAQIQDVARKAGV